MSKLVAEVVHTNKVETDAGAIANFRKVGNTYDYNGVGTPTEVLDTFPTWCNRIEVKFSNIGCFSNTQVAWFTFGNSSGGINPFNATAGSCNASWQAPGTGNTEANSNVNIVIPYISSNFIYSTGSMFAERIYPAENIWRCYGSGHYRITNLTGPSGTWYSETQQTDLSASNPTKFGITRQGGTIAIYGKWTSYYYEY
jgi:hypothetical protein